MSIITCEHLVFRPFNAPSDILRDISFQLERSQLMMIVGPSGSGKSTLLRLLNRLDDPNQGQRWFMDKPYEQWPIPLLRRRVGLALQGAVMLEGSVLDNILAGPRIWKETVNPEEYLDMVSLPKSYLQRSARELSGGERHRVALARVLANRPDVILLDEPTAALDPRSRIEIGDLIQNLFRQWQDRLAVIWVSHFLDEVERYADDILYLESGTVALHGQWHEIGQDITERFFGNSQQGVLS